MTGRLEMDSPSHNALEFGWVAVLWFQLLVYRERVPSDLPGSFKWSRWKVPGPSMRSRIACVLSEVHT